MNYSRVALLLAFALLGRTADAWIIGSPPITTGERMAVPLLSSAEDFRQVDPPDRAAYWSGCELVSSGDLSRTLESAGVDDDQAGDEQPQYDSTQPPADSEAVHSDMPDAQTAENEENLGVGEQFARLSLSYRGLLLLRTNAEAVISYASNFWQRTVAFCSDHNLNVDKVGLGLQPTFDDFAAAMSCRCPAESQPSVDDGFANLDLVKCPCPGVSLNSSDARPWYYLVGGVGGNWTDDQASPPVQSLAAELANWVETSLEGWTAAFRNTPSQFAQLNWTILLKGQNGQTVDRTTEKTTSTPKRIER